jgi:hypothetical protein
MSHPIDYPALNTHWVGFPGFTCFGTFSISLTVGESSEWITVAICTPPKAVCKAGRPVSNCTFSRLRTTVLGATGATGTALWGAVVWRTSTPAISYATLTCPACIDVILLFLYSSLPCLDERISTFTVQFDAPTPLPHRSWRHSGTT